MKSFEEIINIVKNLPYGRNSNRHDFSLVLMEKKGSCSSKHAFLKEFADKNNIKNVQLYIGIYKMNESNTNIGSILSENKISYIPEAHCYLKIDNQYIDATSPNADFEKLRNDIMEEIEIEPYQVADFKVEFHQKFIKNWIVETNQIKSFDEIWEIREKCIQLLSN